MFKVVLYFGTLPCSMGKPKQIQIHIAVSFLRCLIPCLSRKQKVHSRVHNSEPSIPTFLLILLGELLLPKSDMSHYFLNKSCIICHMFEIKYVLVVYWRYVIKIGDTLHLLV
jgi:hypothetical protein